MRNDSDKIAIIDIGSNSVRLFIFQITDGKAEQIFAEKAFCGLGKDLGLTARLNSEAIGLTHKALNSYRQEIDKNQVRSEIVIGTAALREAGDAAEFLVDVKARYGFDIKIISGDEEAHLAALAVLAANDKASGVVADFGGGSLELAKISDGKIFQKVSLKLGAHYLKASDNRAQFIDREFSSLLADIPEFSQPDNLYIIGGSWRSLAKAWLQSENMTRETVEGFTFQGDAILSFCRILQDMEPTELIERYNMEPARARLMDVSALMLEKIIVNLEPENVKVSTAGIRDGLAYEYIQGQAK